MQFKKPIKTRPSQAVLGLLPAAVAAVFPIGFTVAPLGDWAVAAALGAALGSWLDSELPSATGFLATAEAAALEAATKGRTTLGAARAPEAGVVADDTATEFVSVVAGRDGEVKT